jgi:DNA helicase-2/ATP-dependent DNA helicase PcrA
MTPTPEQQAIYTLAETSRESFIIEARAGSGKTKVLIDLLAQISGSSLLMAFNRSIADECKQRAGKILSFEKALDVNISTVHSHGLASFRRAGAKPKTLDGKTSFMLKDMLNAQADKGDDIWRNMGKVSHLVSYAKAAGFGLDSISENFPAIGNVRAWHLLAEHFAVEDDLIGDTTIEEVIEYAQQILNLSNKRTNSIDFDDMIYLPLLLNLPLPQYDNVLIDEAQDINATRRELAFRSIKPGGRLIAVGDPYQAIYGFTGADALSLENIGKRIGHEVRTMPLSICWRCDSRIIGEAQKIVPDIQARPGAGEGQVLTVPYIAAPPPPERAQEQRGYQGQNGYGSEDLFSLAQPGYAILCRLNKPNVATCLGFLRRGKRARIEGRDLGKRLEHHVQKAADGYAFQPLDETLMELDVYEQQELGKMASKNKSEASMALFEDEIDAARLIIERCTEENRKASWADFTRLLGELFGDNIPPSQVITLSSIHKAKGREWPRVFILGRDSYMPFHLAKQDWEMEQEHNLIYVATTRAERTLIYVTGVQSAIDKGEHREVKRPAPAADIVGNPPLTLTVTPSMLQSSLRDERRDHFCNECGALKSNGGYGDCENPACARSNKHAPDFLLQSVIRDHSKP